MLIATKTLFSMMTVACSVVILTACKTFVREQSEHKAFTNFRNNEAPVDLTIYEATDEELAKVKTEFPVVYQMAEKRFKSLKMPGKIKLEEATALRLYTGSIYSPLNNSLRAKDPSTLPQYANTIKAAASGLNHLPAEACTASRGIDGLSAVALDTLQKKKRYKEAGFTSTTFEGEGFRGFILFTIKSNYCRKIDWLSIHEDEHEALFPPGSEFIVDKAEFAEKTVSGVKVMTGVVELTHTMEKDPAGEPPTISTEPDPGSAKFKKSDILLKSYQSHARPELSFRLSDNNELEIENDKILSRGYWSVFGDIITLIPNDASVFKLSLGENVQLKVVNWEKFGWIDPKDSNNVIDVFTVDASKNSTAN